MMNQTRLFQTAAWWMIPACTEVFFLPPESVSNMTVEPASAMLPSVTPPDCPDPTCCSLFAPEDIGATSADTCCGRFDVTIRGTGTMTAMRWLPGPGSNLVVLADRPGPIAASPDRGGTFPVCYRLTTQEVPSCADEPTSPVCETGLPPDDGILRLFFENQPTIDIWVEVP